MRVNLVYFPYYNITNLVVYKSGLFMPIRRIYYDTKKVEKETRKEILCVYDCYAQFSNNELLFKAYYFFDTKLNCVYSTIVYYRDLRLSV